MPGNSYKTLHRILIWSSSICFNGDKYLNSRPMKRVTQPLREIGAEIDGRKNGNFAPIHIRGKKLKSFDYYSKIASAQVKSAMILSALQADGVSYYEEIKVSRDHSERMLKGMGADIEMVEESKIKSLPLRKKFKAPFNY